MDEYFSNMGKCICGNLQKCAEVQKNIIEAGYHLHYEIFTVLDHNPEKINNYRVKCVYWLGVPKGVKIMHTRKHHLIGMCSTSLRSESNN